MGPGRSRRDTGEGGEAVVCRNLPARWVGQAVIQASRVAGAARVVAVEPAAAKRELALWLGAADATSSAPHPTS